MVTLTVTDEQGTTGTDTLTIVVQNVTPTVDAGTDLSLDEGGSVALHGAFTDPGESDSPIYRWDFGDGAAVQNTLDPTHTYADDGIYTVTLTVTDKDNASGADTLLVTVSNVAPTVQLGTDRTVGVGESTLFTGTFGDPGLMDTHTLEWDFGDGQTATQGLTHTHEYTAEGSYTVALTVTDNEGDKGSDSIIVHVSDSDQPPLILAEESYAGVENGVLAFEVLFEDDGDSLRYETLGFPFDDRNTDDSDDATITELPGGNGFGFHWTPAFSTVSGAEDVRDFRLTVIAYDDAGNSATKQIDLRIAQTDVFPELAVATQHQVKQDGILSFPLSITDDGSSFTITHLPESYGSVTQDPTGSSLASFTWNTQGVAPGIYTLEFQVIDADGLEAMAEAQVTISAANRPPVLSNQPLQEPWIRDYLVDEEDTLTIGPIFAEDPDPQDTLLLTVETSPLWLNTSDLTNGILVANPQIGDAGTHIVTIVVADDGDPVLSDSQAISIRVQAANNPPSWTFGAETTFGLRKNVLFELDLAGFASDPDVGDEQLSYEASDLPQSATLIGSILTWLPSADQTGKHSITISVEDAHGGTATALFHFDVTSTNSPPTLKVVGETTILQTGLLVLQLAAEDPDADNTGFTYAVEPLEPWMALEPNLGLIVNHREPVPGTYNLTASVTDSDGASAQVVILVTVEADEPDEPTLPPQLQTVHITSASPVTVGGTVSVTATGNAGNFASLTIPGLAAAASILMIEISAGLYEGAYVVQPKDQVLGLPVTVHLSDALGNSVSMASSELLHIDTEALARNASIEPSVVQNGGILTVTLLSEVGATVTVNLAEVDTNLQAPVPLIAEANAPVGDETVFRANIGISPQNDAANGFYPVFLTVVDAAGNTAYIDLSVRLANEPPPDDPGDEPSDPGDDPGGEDPPVVVDTTPPSAVVLFSSNMSVSSTHTEIRWLASVDAESGIADYEYSVDSQLNGQPSTLWESTGGTDTRVTLSGLIDSTYEIWLRAKNGEGLYSTPVKGILRVDSTPPSPASNLQIETLPGAIVRLSWNLSTASDVALYHIYSNHGMGSIDYTNAVASVAHPGTGWVSGLLTDGGQYAFAVRAVDTLGNEESNTVVHTDPVLVRVNDPPTVLALSVAVGLQAGDVSLDYTVEDREGDWLHLTAEYSLDQGLSWLPATTEGAAQVPSREEYQGSVTWHSRKDIPSTPGIDVLVRITPRDAQDGTPRTTNTFRVANLLGDYDDDLDIDFQDLEPFVVALRSHDARWDIGPAAGELPNLVPALDGKLDFEDLAVFVLMWNWWYEQNSHTAPSIDLYAYLAQELPGFRGIESEPVGLPLPTRTQLLPNYPNPLNPETWIPYQLAEGAVITLTIHEASGKQVRTLDLGWRQVGSYLSQERAAYWDGRDQHGSVVASGLYFCTIRAGAFHATRRLVVVR